MISLSVTQIHPLSALVCIATEKSNYTIQIVRVKRSQIEENRQGKENRVLPTKKSVHSMDATSPVLTSRIVSLQSL